MRGSLLPGVLGHNGAVLFGKKRVQRITVGLIVGLVVLSLALTLVGGALAAPRSEPTGAGAVPPVAEGTTTPSGIVSTDNPKPVTETPQGTSTQVTDEEHIGGLIAYIVFMLAGVLLLLRGKRRERQAQAEEGRSESILSLP